MHHDLASARLRDLIGSPGGCALLLKMAAAGIAPADAVEPETALHLISNAIGDLNPWDGAHDGIVERLLQEGPQHIDLARELLVTPGIERWWAPLDRERQVWMQPWKDATFPDSSTFPEPSGPPTRFEHYTQRPENHVSTSTLLGDWTSQLATCTSGSTDWILDYPARRKLVRVSPHARVYEVVNAEHWHALVAAHGVRSTPDMTFHPGTHDAPWGANDGLVPDWQAIAREWDGVHITLWAFLTATQVRVTSEAGWTEMWSREGEETTWLRWVFDTVADLPPVDPIPQGRQWSLPFHIPSPFSVRIVEE
jgi:hypothetical protein